METNVADSVSLKSRTVAVLSAVNEKISLQCESTDFINKLNEPFSSDCEISIPVANFEQLKISLEILGRLPALFLQFSNNFSLLGTIDASTIIQKYKKIVSDIEETNNKLTEIAVYSGRIIDSM